MQEISGLQQTIGSAPGQHEGGKKHAIKAGERKSGNGKARVKFEAWPMPP